MTETAAAPPSAKPPLFFWVGLSSVVAIAALYVLMPVANFTDAKDSLRYALRIGEGAPYFHPNHLLYEPVVYVFHRLAEVLAGPIDPIHVMQGFSIFCAVPFLFLVYLLTWRASCNAAVAALCTGAVGFSFGVWVYSVSPDGYLPPLFLALLALALLDPKAWRARHETLSRKRLVGAALAMAAAVLLHQMYVIFALVTGFALLFRAEFGGLKTRAWIFLTYGGISGGLTLLVYLIVHRFVAADMAFFDWARGFARDGLYYGDPPSLLSPLKGAVGALSTMLTMNGLMAFDFLADRLMMAFPGKSLLEERFIAETAIAAWLRLPILLAMLGATLLWLAAAGTAVAERWRRQRAPEYADTVLLVAVILYAAAVIVWEPTNREFWIQTYAFATIWTLRQIARLTRARTLVLGGLAGCLFTVNFFAGLSPLSNSRSDYWRVYNAPAIERRGQVDLVISSCSWLCMWYLRYFAQAEVISPARVDPADLRARIEATPPGRVLVSSLAYAPHGLAGEYNARTIVPAWTEAFRAAYPPPGPLPQDDSRQVFFTITEAGLVPLE